MTTIGKTAREAAEELRQKIQYHDHRYYVLDAPQVADGEYDGMMRSLRMLEKEHPEIRDENSPTQRVGGMVSANFSVVDHPEPMLSLANAMTSRGVRRVAHPDRQATVDGGIPDERGTENRRAGHPAGLP